MDNSAFHLRKYWYIGAYSHEVERKPLARRMLDKPIVMYRLQDGTVAAVEDRCPHRRALLSSGKIVGDHIQCGYHGVEINAQGRCAKIPDQNNIPPQSSVRSYVTQERDGFVWLWMGDEDGNAKLDEVPDLSHFSRPGLTQYTTMIKLKSSLVWGLENSMDSSHIAYVHHKTFTDDVVTGFAVKHWTEGNSVTYRREIIDSPLPPLFSQVMGFSGHADRTQEIKFVAPSLILLLSRTRPTGSTDPKQARNLYVNALTTPESIRSLWLYVQIHRDFEPDNPELDQFFNQSLLEALDEDQAMIEQQQINWDEDGPDVPMIDIKTDGASVAMRRVMKRLFREQNGADIPMPWSHMQRV